MIFTQKPKRIKDRRNSVWRKLKEQGEVESLCSVGAPLWKAQRGRRGSSSWGVLLSAGQRAGGQPTCRRMPPFQCGELDLHFTCHSACQGQGQCRRSGGWVRLPHCTLALYGLGAGSLKGFAEQQQGLSSSFSGNLHFGGKFSLRRKLSYYSLHLRSQGRQLRGLFPSQEEGERIKLSGILLLFIHRVCMVHLQCDRFCHILAWQGGQDKIFASRHQLVFWGGNYKTKCDAFVSVFAILSIYTKKVKLGMCTEISARDGNHIFLSLFYFLFSIDWNPHEHSQIERDS